MAQTTITHFTRVIQENLFQGRDWVAMSVSHDAFSDGETVKIPTAGTELSITKNRSSYPITVEERTDGTRSYDLDKYDAGAILIPEDDKRELSYNKAQAIMSEKMNVLNERIGLEALYAWTPSETDKIFESTGSTIARNPSGSVSTRKAVLHEDIAKVAAALSRENAFVRGKMKAVFPADMYYSMLSDNTEMLSREYMNFANLPEGIVDRVHGFDIMVTGETMRFDTNAAGGVKAIGSALAASDDWCALFYNEDFVARALGTIKVFLDRDSAEYQGDLYSAYVRFAATQLRASNVGVAAIIQAG